MTNDDPLSLLLRSKSEITRFQILQVIEDVRTFLGVHVGHDHGRTAGSRCRSQLVPSGKTEWWHVHVPVLTQADMDDFRIHVDRRDDDANRLRDRVNVDCR